MDPFRSPSVRRTAAAVSAAPDPDEFDPTKHTIDDVLAWVGDDDERAQYAYDVETERGDKARVTLLAALAGDPDEELAGAGGELAAQETARAARDAKLTHP